MLPALFQNGALVFPQESVDLQFSEDNQTTWSIVKTLERNYDGVSLASNQTGNFTTSGGAGDNITTSIAVPAESHFFQFVDMFQNTNPDVFVGNYLADFPPPFWSLSFWNWGETP